MPAHERRPDQPLDAYLCRILLALTRQAGGELRVREADIDIDVRQCLVRDFDPKTGEIVFRATSRYAEPIWVEPVQSAWTIPFEERAHALGLDTANRHHAPATDQELAEKERLQRLRKTTRPQGPLPTTA